MPFFLNPDNNPLPWTVTSVLPPPAAQTSDSEPKSNNLADGPAGASSELNAAQGPSSHSIEHPGNESTDGISAHHVHGASTFEGTEDEESLHHQRLDESEAAEQQQCAEGEQPVEEEDKNEVRDRGNLWRGNLYRGNQ